MRESVDGEVDYARATTADVTSIDKRWIVPEDIATAQLGTKLLYLMLREDGPLTRKTITDRLNGNCKTVGTRLNTMRKQGIVDRRRVVTDPNTTFYVLTEEYRPHEQPLSEQTESARWREWEE